MNASGTSSAMQGDNLKLINEGEWGKEYWDPNKTDDNIIIWAWATCLQQKKGVSVRPGDCRRTYQKG